ncbi:MAG TPA: YceI family protein [Candidatus Dormibacteraeota bacterium]|nr:YceI family protein [Candidatus Dormibacteraeota bacterium]
MGHILHRAFITAAIAGVLSLPAAAATATWKVDPAHTAAEFGVKHLMISTVRGSFKGVKGTVNWDDSDVTKSTVNVTIDATTVDTGEPARDKDLKSDKFFDTADNPTLTFKSTKVEEAGAGKLKVTGDLTIRGVTKQVVLDVDGPSASIKDPYGNTRSALSASTKINRQDFGVKWNANLDGGGVVVGDDVNINIDLEMVKQK